MGLAFPREIELHRDWVEHGAGYDHAAAAGEVDQRRRHRRAHPRDPQIDSQVHRLAEKHPAVRRSSHHRVPVIGEKRGS